MSNFLIYGANGYTGELITRYAVERGLKPILAGRNSAAIEALAAEHQLEYRAFSLDETSRLDAALEEVDAVLHCAGPFSITSKPMVEACLRTRTHYTDITGEIEVFEACAQMDARASEAGVMLMPGVGFDVVPSDCLALHLKDRLPTATHLTLAFRNVGRLSHGTKSTMLMNIGRGGAVRVGGKITSVPAGWKTRKIDLGEGEEATVTIPWGDIATAFHSTGIPNIEVYTAVPPSQLRLLKLSRHIGWLLSKKFLQKYLQKNVPSGGPSDEQRARGKTLMWGEACDADGNRVEARQQCPEAYTLTAITSLNIIEKILDGDFTAGYQTPAKAYGPDLILEINGVSRVDISS